MAGARRAPRSHRTHRRRSRSSGPIYAASIVTALVVALGAIFALHENGSQGASCSGATVLRITTTPVLAPPLTQVASEYNRAKHTVGGTCASVQVTAAASADTVTALQKTTTAAAPDVWAPDSTNWLTLARTSANAARLFPSAGTPIASSPVVIASPMPMARAIDWPTTELTWGQLAKDETDPKFWANRGHAAWGPFKVGFALPATSEASLQAVVGVAAASANKQPGDLVAASYSANRGVQLGILNLERNTTAIPPTTAALIAGQRAADPTGGTSYLSAFPLQESDLVAYNRGAGAPGGQPPKVLLAASYPSDGLFSETIPYVVSTRAAGDPVRSRLAGEFLASLQTAAGVAALTSAGFRAPDGTNNGLTEATGTMPALLGAQPADRPEPVLASALTIFAHIHRRGSTLAVLDTSGSMAEIVPGTGQTKLQIAASACVEALPLFAKDDYLGSWAFSTNRPTGGNYTEISPIVQVGSPGVPGPTHRDDLATNFKLLTPQGNTALYQTALAAYQKATSVYRAGRLNQVVLLTDGENDDPGDPGDLSLPTLISKLKALYNPRKPVRIITIAYGAEADPQVLRQISDATGARSYQSRDPKQILDVFIDAVTQSE